MELVTKEHLNKKGWYLKCDIPIWEEFALGLITTGGIALNVNFMGVRVMFCHREDMSLCKTICIVTKNPKQQKIYNMFEYGFKLDESRGSIKDLKIEKFYRCNKNIYIIEYKRNGN